MQSLLEQCLSTDNATRVAAEAAVQSTPDAQLLPELLPLLSLEQSSTSMVRILSLTILKARVRSHWFIHSENSKYYIAPELKINVKQTLAQVLFHLSDPFQQTVVLNLLMDTINLIQSYERSSDKKDPSMESMMVQVTDQMCQQHTDREFFLSILAIQSIVKHHKFNVSSSSFVNDLLIKYQPWLKYGVECNFNADGSNLGKIKHQLVKFYQYITIVTIPQSISNEQELGYIVQFVINNVSNLQTPPVAKWSIKFLLNIFKKNANSKVDINFLNYITNSLTSEIINQLMSQHLSQICQFDNKVTEQFTQLLMLSLLNESTYKILKPYLESIINLLIIPNCSLDEDEIEEFEDDPSSFINRLNIDDNIYQQFLKLLINNDSSIHSPLLELTNHLLNSGDDKIIVCGLSILTCLIPKMNQNDLNVLINQILAINSSLTANRLWLRCYIYELLTYTPVTVYETPFWVEPLNIQIGSNLPLPLLISSLKLSILQKLSYNVFECMNILLNINLDISYELIDLVLLDHEDEVRPFNLEIVKKLSENFVNLYQTSQQEQEQEVMDQLVSIMTNFQTIILTTSDKDTLFKINDQISQIIEIIFLNGILDLIEESMELLESINFMTKQVFNLNLVVESFKQFGIEYPDLYNVYFQSVYQYGSQDDFNQLNETIEWLYHEGLGDDWELNDVLLQSLPHLMIHPASSQTSNDIFGKVLNSNYELVGDKDQFFQNKGVLRCIMAGLVHQPGLVLGMFAIDDIVQSLEMLMQSESWTTVFDIKLAILGLCGALQQGAAGSSKIVDLIMRLVSKLEPALDHRMKLMRLEKEGLQHEQASDGEPAEAAEEEIVYDEEFDELNMETRLDGINVLEVVRGQLH